VTSRRLVCTTCTQTAVTTIDQAQRLFFESVAWVKRLGIQYNQTRLHLELCGPERLRHIKSQSQSIDALGATFQRAYVKDQRMARVEVDGVALLSGLPATLFQGVAVHELGHVWLAVQQVMELPSWAEEGFGEALARRLFTQMDTPEGRYHARAIERRRDLVYGEGYRRVQACIDKHGWARVLGSLAQHKQLPPG
jgi:hypothetical protein